MYDKNIKFWLSKDQYNLLFIMSMRRQVSMSKILRKAVEAATDLLVKEWQEQAKKLPQEKLTKEHLCGLLPGLDIGDLSTVKNKTDCCRPYKFRDD